MHISFSFLCRVCHLGEVVQVSTLKAAIFRISSRGRCDLKKKKKKKSHVMKFSSFLSHLNSPSAGGLQKAES